MEEEFLEDLQSEFDYDFDEDLYSPPEPLQIGGMEDSDFLDSDDDSVPCLHSPCRDFEIDVDVEELDMEELDVEVLDLEELDVEDCSGSVRSVQITER
ncbi:hypothetical protein B5X24_HaOG211215 [Helicoverpa armigera]|nr:hypothetical protein B5X24_HaOG211215 [Helicoverpa armigera]